MSRWLEKQREREQAEAQMRPQQLLPALETPEFVRASQFKASEFQPGDFYVWQTTDTISDFYELARRMNTTKERLMEYNEIEDLDELEPGIAIHRPIASGDERPPIRYEVYPAPRDMHVSRAGGAKKWLFGNVSTWDDFKSKGFYPRYTNIRIVAVAIVPVDDEESPEAGFYLDSVALGDFQKTGRVRFTMGYRWSDLSDGIAEKIEVKTAPPPPEPPAPAKSMDVTPAPRREFYGVDRVFLEKRLEDLQRGKSLTGFTSTYQPHQPAIPCIAMLPREACDSDEDGLFLWVHDYLTSRKDRKLRQHQEIDIAGTFEVDGTLYGRPAAAVPNGYWFGIPMDYLQSQAHVYNVAEDTETRASEDRLTRFEKWFWAPVSRLAHSRRFKRRQNKNNKE